MRKEVEIRLNDRGNELVFILREMSASQLEKWLYKTALLLSKAYLKKANLQEEIDDNDLYSFKIFSKILSKNALEYLLTLDFHEAEPLIDELLTCVHRKLDSALIALNNDNIDAHIHDVQTLFKLRLEVVKLNLDFFTTDEASPTDNSIQAEQKQEEVYRMQMFHQGKPL